MHELQERVAALESIFASYDLGDWTPGGNKVPYWLAIRITPQDALQIVSAVQLAAQAKALQGSQGEGSNRLMAEIVDEWCGTPPHKGPGPRPHWGRIVEHLGTIADRFPTGSLLSEAAFDLARRVVNRAHEAHKQAISQ